MAKVLLVGDLHHSDTAPSSCTDSYTDDIFELCYHTVRIAKERSCDAAIWAGDVLDKKAPSKNSHRLVQRIIELAGAYHCPLFIVPGNHDVTNGRFASLFETQPLGTILGSGAAHLLTGWHFKPTHLGADYKPPTSPSNVHLPIFGVPWVQDWSNVNENSREEAVTSATVDMNRESDGSFHSLLITHAPFYPPGQELPYENYPTPRFVEKLPDNVSVYYGHIHQPHGIYTVNDTTFANLGAISRGSLDEYNLTRDINVTLWDSDTGLFEVIPVPHKPASEVFKIAEVGEKKQIQMELDAFLSSVGKTSIEITSIESVISHVRTMGLSVEVTRAVEDLLESAGK